MMAESNHLLSCDIDRELEYFCKHLLSILLNMLQRTDNLLNYMRKEIR